MGPKTNEQAKPTSLTLPRPSDPLFDELTAKVSINQTLNGSLDGIHKAITTDAVPLRKPCQGFGFEDAHKVLFSYINYSLYNYISRELSARIVRFWMIEGAEVHNGGFVFTPCAGAIPEPLATAGRGTAPGRRWSRPPAPARTRIRRTCGSAAPAC